MNNCIRWFALICTVVLLPFAAAAEGLPPGDFSFVGSFLDDANVRQEAILNITLAEAGQLSAILALKGNPAMQRRFSGSMSQSEGKTTFSMEADPASGATSASPSLLQKGSAAAIILSVKGDRLTSPSYNHGFRLLKSAAAIDLGALPAASSSAAVLDAPAPVGHSVTAVAERSVGDASPTPAGVGSEITPNKPVPSSPGAYIWENGSWQKLGSAKLKPLIDLLGLGSIFAKTRDMKVEGEQSRTSIRERSPAIFIRGITGKVIMTQLTPKKGVRTQKLHLVPNKQPAEYDLRPEDLIPFVETEEEPGIRKLQVEIALNPGEHLFIIGDWKVENGMPVPPPAFEFAVNR